MRISAIEEKEKIGKKFKCITIQSSKGRLC